MPGYSLTTVSSGKLSKVLSKIAQVSMVQCFSLKVNGVITRSLQEDAETIPLALQQVLCNFKMSLKNQKDYHLVGAKITG